MLHKQQMIRITSPSRLHIGLIDMNASCGRVDGGVGLSLASPHITISAEISSEIEVIGDSSFAARMKKAAEILLPKGKGIKISIEEDIPPHIGCGSGTQAALCASAAVNELYNLNMSVKGMAIAVGRGGTSGIGVASFQKGGFIVDGGHKFVDKGSFSPSSASKTPPAPVIFREDFPQWDIILALPKSNCIGAHDIREVDIFKQMCPIPLHEVQTVSHIVLMQLMPAIMDQDIESFSKGINQMQTIGFKHREVQLQDPAVRDLIELLQDNGAYGAGMSSFGPIVFAFSDNHHESIMLQNVAQSFLSDTLGGDVMITHANNTGASIVEE